MGNHEAQIGGIAIPLSVVLIFFGSQANALTFALFTFLAVFLAWIGYVSLRQAGKIARREARDIGTYNRTIIALLEAIAQTQGINTSELPKGIDISELVRQLSDD